MVQGEVIDEAAADRGCPLLSYHGGAFRMWQKIDAGAIRFRPMMLTAAAVVVGASVILFDPIFQGLAISLMAGEVASLLFSRMTVPVLYFMSRQGKKDVSPIPV